MSLSLDKTRDPHPLLCNEIWGGTQATEAILSVPGLDVHVLSRPYEGDTDGGDIYYVGLCGRAALSRFVVADVAGHGQAVADLAGRLHRLMGLHMHTPDQSELVRSLNGEFATLVDTEMFATALVMSYLASSDTLVTVNAGHPRPLWYCRAEDRWRLLSHEDPAATRGSRDLPLGVLTDSGYYPFAIQLGKGDLVVLYTDSLIEAQDHAGRMLGQVGLLHLARDLGVRRPEELAGSLVRAVTDFHGGGDLEDDVTVLTLHHRDGGP